MSKGHVFLAQNSDVDYVRQAYALALSIKKHNEINATCIITNDPIPDEYVGAFDHVVAIPWGDSARDANWKIENRWKIIHTSPFKENIVYDTDMLLLNSNDHWWRYFEGKDLAFTSTVVDYRNNVVASDYYRKTFTLNNLDNIYVGAFYFKKTSRAYEFFKWLEVIAANWQEFYSRYTPNKPQKFCSMDVNAALAIKFMGCASEVVVKDTLIPSFTHMKPAIQGWTNVPVRWTDVLAVSVNKDSQVKIAGFQQQGLLHYVEDEFLTDDILYKLMR
jgi:hypothetical protein